MKAFCEILQHAKLSQLVAYDMALFLYCMSFWNRYTQFVFIIVVCYYLHPILLNGVIY